MPFSIEFFIGHCLCTGLLALLIFVWQIDRRWQAIFAFLFFISVPAVYLIWGPFRYYALYGAAFVFFLGLAKAINNFHIFLQTQEAAIRWVFWAAVLVFAVLIATSSISEINLRRDPMTFWSHQAKQRPTALALNNLADTFAAAKNFAEAKVFYQKAAIKDPQSIRAWEGLEHMAQSHKDWNGVIRLSRKIIELDNRSSQSYLNLGEAYRDIGNSKQAVETYSRLLELFPDDEQVDIKVIEAYGQAIAQDPVNDLYKEKREEVLADFEQLSKRKNYTAGDYFNLGFLYAQVGGKEEAMRFYAKALALQPDNEQALAHLADLYRDAGNVKAAMALYERLVHFHPKNAAGYLNMGIIFNALGDQARARQYYLKVINLDPDNGDAYYYLGYISESQGELNDAVNDYEKAVELSPKNAEAFYNLGNAYASLGQNGEAIASYLKTIAINPRHQDAFVNLSILSFKSRDFQGAIHYLEDAQKLGYNPPGEYLKTLEPYRK